MWQEERERRRAARLGVGREAGGWRWEGVETGSVRGEAGSREATNLKKMERHSRVLILLISEIGRS